MSVLYMVNIQHTWCVSTLCHWPSATVLFNFMPEKQQRRVFFVWFYPLYQSSNLWQRLKSWTDAGTARHRPVLLSPLHCKILRYLEELPQTGTPWLRTGPRGGSMDSMIGHCAGREWGPKARGQLPAKWPLGQMGGSAQGDRRADRRIVACNGLPLLVLGAVIFVCDWLLLLIWISHVLGLGLYCKLYMRQSPGMHVVT